MTNQRKSTTHSSRRQIITAAGALLAASASGRVGAAVAQNGTEEVPFSSEQEIWRDVVFMNDLGPRYCGNAAHKKFHSFLDDKMAASGLKVEHLKHSALVLWDPIRTSIRTTGSYGAREIPVASFCRWSAVTGPEGLTAPLKYCGRAEGPSSWNRRALYPNAQAKLPIPSDVAGKIALVEMTATPCEWHRWYEGHVTMVDPLKAGPLGLQTTAPAWGAAGLPPRYQEELRKAGAVGLIFAWVSLTDDDALGQQKGGSEALPSVWVGPTAGRELRAIAEQGGAITLTVDAKITKNVPTETLVATLPGQASDEVIVLWTHTDGNNAIEENGGIAMVHLMKHFAALPKSARRKTIVNVFSEGHFAGQYLPTHAWLDERPDLVKNAVATLSIEHLGCQEWVGDPARNTFTATGKPEPMFVNAPTPALHKIMLEASKSSRLGRYVVLDNAEHALPGSGLDAWRHHDLHLPTISWIAVPPYLMAEGRNGHIDKMRPDQFHDEVGTLARIIRGYDAAPKNVLRPA